MMRAIWKGHIQFSLVTIPVRIYNAIETAETIRFNQLHKKDNGPIGYEKKCKKCNKVVSNDEIVKGYQYEPDRYVIIEESDLEKIRLKSTKIIEIEGFVDASEVHPSLYDSPYFAGPDGEVATKAYTLLCQTLKQTGKLGIGRVVLRDRENVMLIAPEENGLMLYKLRYPNEVRNIQSVPQLNGVQVSKEELKLARTLVESMSTSFTELELTDRYKDALRELIQAKIEGKEVVTVEVEEKPVVDIMTALKQSIEQAKKQKKPMKKAVGKVAEAKAEKAKTTGTKKRKAASG
ncbi:MAG: Ku protein [Calditrichaeota bacterium]|nr:MAG: Ku protein [Calditrichota bacterium]